VRTISRVPRYGLAALGAGLALGACAVVAVALLGRADQANVGGLCLAPSPVRALAAPGRPCDRLALNLVTLPYLTGAVLLLPRLPGRIAARLVHALAALAPAAVAAAVLAGRGTPPDAALLLAAGVLAATVLTGALHLWPGRPAARTAAHLGLAAAWLALAAGANVAVTLGR